MEDGVCPGIVADHFGMGVVQRCDAISNGFVVFKIVPDANAHSVRKKAINRGETTVRIRPLTTA
ncbi:hypothetical protein D3C87_2126070 [compost metagenome]